MLGVLVDDGAVLQVPQVEHAHGAVGAHRGEHVPAAARAAEGDVVHLPRAQSTAQLTPRGAGRDSPDTGHSPSNASCSLPLLSYYTCQKGEMRVCVITVSLAETKTYPLPRLGDFYISRWQVKCWNERILQAV